MPETQQFSFKKSSQAGKIAMFSVSYPEYFYVGGYLYHVDEYDFNEFSRNFCLDTNYHLLYTH